MTGRVLLVGGGPGDPGLVTVAGLAALTRADVVLYDHLAPQSSLASCRPDAELIDVGKLPGGRSTSQQRINELLVEHARAGRYVVRFKGGDPFVFGRGGEEVIACADAGIEVEVIPGVTSAVAGPALAGIPVTHRGVVQAFTVVSGHVPPRHEASTTDWGALARANHTIVVLMGVANLAPICAELVAQGLPDATPAAVIADAWLPTMRTTRGTVGTIAAMTERAGVRPPAVVVIGELADRALPLSPPEVVGERTAVGDELRPARPEDAGELLVLQRACWTQEAIDNGSLDIPALHEDLAAVSAGLGQWQTWVLRRGGRLIGSVRGQLDGTTWEIGRLMVAADLAGQGLGRLLLECVERQAPPEATTLRLFTGAGSARNLRLYRAAGYALTGEPAPPLAVMLAKPISGPR
ncbi:MAG TPA: uroporphyrinogen-III C-methyltransferase [Micropruina sp.]|nr:uroporphyrinogen-III C-methyltransferase [Micropruina sp.]